MRDDHWKWIAGVLAALLVAAVGAGMYFGRLPTRDDIEKMEETQRQFQEQVSRLEWLLTAHGITVEALRHAEDHVAEPGSPDSDPTPHPD